MTLLAVPCCVVVAFVALVYMKRRRLLPARTDAWLTWKSGGLQPIDLRSERNADDQQSGTELVAFARRSDFYEYSDGAAMIAIPSRPDLNSPFALANARGERSAI